MFWITPAVFFAFGGLAVAGVLSYQALDPAILERLCAQNGGCLAVHASRYAKIGAVPIAWLGLGFYAVALVGTLSAMACPLGKTRKRLLWAAMVGGIAGSIISIGLMVVQAAVVRAMCALCTLSAIFCLAWAWSIWRVRREDQWEARPWGAAGLGLVLAAVGTVGFMALRQGTGARAQILAIVNGRAITSLELERESPGALKRLNEELYDVKRDWLDRKIAQALVEQEAAARGVSIDRIFEELEQKIQPQYDEVDRWIAQIKRDNPLAWQIEAAARQDIHRRAFEEYLAGLKSRAQIEIRLEKPPAAPQYDPALAHTQGATTFVTVRLVLYSEFECPYCAELAQTLDQVLAKYPDVSLTFVHTPMPFHELSMPAAEASECAAEQGRFWPYHDRLMKLQGQIEPRWEEYAKEVGLDLARFRECIKSGRGRARVEKARQSGVAMGLVGVPALYLNGRKVGGAISFEDLCALIDVERKKAAGR